MLDKKMLLSYLRQQKQLSMPELFFKKPAFLKSLFKDKTTAPLQVKAPSLEIKTIERKAIVENTSVSVKNTDTEPGIKSKFPFASRLSSLKPVEQIAPEIKARPAKKIVTKNSAAGANSGDSNTTFDQKRAALRMLYYAGCRNCSLSQTRKTFVFGAGVANAPVMVIGEAPGTEEDEQGLPFVGAVGQLLTSMLSAINLDRNKNVFITNILKCRPPENRNPESSESLSCMPILEKQIAIIQPKALLLLGQIAANSVLGLTDSIEKLRSKTHLYKGIPAMAIYHPAALLKNSEYKRPAWEDLQKFQSLLTDVGVYDLSKE